MVATLLCNRCGIEYTYPATGNTYFCASCAGYYEGENKKMNSGINSDVNPKSNPDSIPNEFPNEFLNKNRNKFENKFGINSKINLGKKLLDFEQKYPKIYWNIFNQTVLEYLMENPEIFVEIFENFLKKTAEIVEEEIGDKYDK